MSIPKPFYLPVFLPSRLNTDRCYSRKQSHKASYWIPKASVNMTTRVLRQKQSYWRWRGFGSFSLTPRPSLKKRHIEKWLAFSIPKTTSSFGYKKQVSIWQRGSPSKTVILEYDLILVLKKQTPYSQGYYCQSYIEHGVVCRVKNSRMKDTHSQG